MTGDGTDTIGERLILQSRMSELAQLPAWIEDLASRHSIPASTQFAIHLCLEEALSNIIQHGYAGRPDRPITVQFAIPREDYFVVVVEDEAPPFNPVEAAETPGRDALLEIQVGGQGIRLLRGFSDTLEYQATPNGNRLSIGFSGPRSIITND